VKSSPPSDSVAANDPDALALWLPEPTSDEHGLEPPAAAGANANDGTDA
jgi:hypothetical protein